MQVLSGQNELISALCDANPRVIACFVNGTPFNVMPWIDKLPAMVEMFYSGMEAGRAAALPSSTCRGWI